jgi:hypothetical protein
LCVWLVCVWRVRATCVRCSAPCGGADEWHSLGSFTPPAHKTCTRTHGTDARTWTSIQECTHTNTNTHKHKHTRTHTCVRTIASTPQTAGCAAGLLLRLPQRHLPARPRPSVWPRLGGAVSHRGVARGVRLQRAHTREHLLLMRLCHQAHAFTRAHDWRCVVRQCGQGEGKGQGGGGVRGTGGRRSVMASARITSERGERTLDRRQRVGKAEES